MDAICEVVSVEALHVLRQDEKPYHWFGTSVEGIEKWVLRFPFIDSTEHE